MSALRMKAKRAAQPASATSALLLAMLAPLACASASRGPDAHTRGFLDPSEGGYRGGGDAMSEDDGGPRDRAYAPPAHALPVESSVQTSDEVSQTTPGIMEAASLRASLATLPP